MCIFVMPYILKSGKHIVVLKLVLYFYRTLFLFSLIEAHYFCLCIPLDVWCRCKRNMSSITPHPSPFPFKPTKSRVTAVKIHGPSQFLLRGGGKA
jgi:hypothetical protein